MQLLIDTSDKDEVIVALLDKEVALIQKTFSARFRQAERLLVEIDKLFLSEKIRNKKIKRIIVENKGESFTALRIGVVTANALGYALGIPVEEKSKKRQNSFKDYDVVRPKYSKEPNITQKKAIKTPAVD